MHLLPDWLATCVHSNAGHVHARDVPCDWLSHLLTYAGAHPALAIAILKWLLAHALTAAAACFAGWPSPAQQQMKLICSRTAAETRFHTCTEQCLQDQYISLEAPSLIVSSKSKMHRQVPFNSVGRYIQQHHVAAKPDKCTCKPNLLIWLQTLVAQHHPLLSFRSCLLNVGRLMPSPL